MPADPFKTNWDDSPDSGTIARIVDANCNRASEGLRVLEDYFRFGMDDRDLAARCKQMRHELASLMERITEIAPLAARDAAGDVGRHVKTPQEFHRPNTSAVLRANFRRVAQAFRSLEEWTKPLQPASSAEIEQLRYLVYELESHWIQRTQRSPLVDRARLYVLIDGAESLESFTQRVAELVEAGVDVLQLREKSLSDGDLLQRAKQLRILTLGTATRCIINDRFDIALLAAADGVHLGQDDLPIQAVRPRTPRDFLIGVSTHSLQQAQEAEKAGADYLGVGPTFPSHTKSFSSFPGTKLLRDVSHGVRTPAFAIGGIDHHNLVEVLRCGMQRIAVSSAVWRAENPSNAVRILQSMLKSRLPDDTGEEIA